MAFAIDFTQARLAEPDDGSARGRIVIGDFEEGFVSPLSFWRKRDYEAHWQIALRRLLQGSSSSALVTELHDPASANYIVWWPLHRRADRVLIHNSILFMDGLDRPFDVDDLFGFVPPHDALTDEGHLPSEWQIDLTEIATFLGL